MIEFLINKSQWIIIIGGVLTLLGTFLVAKKADIASNNQTDILRSNTNLSKENKDLLIKNEINLKTIQLLSDKNVELSEAISNNALKYYDYTLGKDSYCYLKFITSDGETAEFLLCHVGKNSLQDVRITLGDVTNAIEFKPLKNFDEIYDWKEEVNFGTLIPNTKKMKDENVSHLLKIPLYKINGKKYIKFLIDIHSTGHVFKEILEVSLKGSAFFYLNQIVRSFKRFNFF